MVERFNRTLGYLLTVTMHTLNTDWDEVLPIILMAYRTAVHESTGKVPFEVFYRRKNWYSDNMLDLPALSPYAENPTEGQQFARVWQMVKEQIALRNQRMQAHNKQQRGEPRQASFKVGDKVKILIHPRKS